MYFHLKISFLHICIILHFCQFFTFATFLHFLSFFIFASFIFTFAQFFRFASFFFTFVPHTYRVKRALCTHTHTHTRARTSRTHNRLRKRDRERERERERVTHHTPWHTLRVDFPPLFKNVPTRVQQKERIVRTHRHTDRTIEVSRDAATESDTERQTDGATHARHTHEISYWVKPPPLFKIPPLFKRCPGAHTETERLNERERHHHTHTHTSRGSQRHTERPHRGREKGGITHTTHPCSTLTHTKWQNLPRFSKKSCPLYVHSWVKHAQGIAQSCNIPHTHVHTAHSTQHTAHSTHSTQHIADTAHTTQHSTMNSQWPHSWAAHSKHSTQLTSTQHTQHTAHSTHST